MGGAIAALLALLAYGPGPELISSGDEAREALAVVQMMGVGSGTAAGGGGNGAHGSKGERVGLISMTANGSSSAAVGGPWDARY